MRLTAKASLRGNDARDGNIEVKKVRQQGLKEKMGDLTGPHGSLCFRYSLSDVESQWKFLREQKNNTSLSLHVNITQLGLLGSIKIKRVNKYYKNFLSYLHLHKLS